MTSLWNEAGRPRLPVALTLGSASLLGVGLSLPVVTLRKGLTDDSYSVLTGIVDLAHSDEVLLALIVLVFSVVFPVAKLLVLTSILFRPVGEARRGRLLHSLGLLGRWSMLDVFVIAILIGAVRLGMISEAHAERGVYVFGLAILGSMFATVLVERLARVRFAPEEPRVPESGRAERWTSLTTLVLFALGLVLPLMVVEKFRFWDNEYSVLAASLRMWSDGEYALAATVLFFVVLLPLARLAGLVLLRWTRPPRGVTRAVLELEKWAMLDVFGLALLVVVAKIGALATVETKSGFWVLLAAAALSLYDTWALRHPRTGTDSAQA